MLILAQDVADKQGTLQLVLAKLDSIKCLENKYLGAIKLFDSRRVTLQMRIVDTAQFSGHCSNVAKTGPGRALLASSAPLWTLQEPGEQNHSFGVKTFIALKSFEPK